MIELKRDIYDRITNYLVPGKVILLLGTRRTGKTFLLKKIMENSNFKIMFLNGEDFQQTFFLQSKSLNEFKNVLGNCQLLVIDEAQKIPDIGQVLKLIIDGIEGIRIIVSGSSSFDIINKAGEPLTGRKFTFLLFPFSEKEYSPVEDVFQRSANLKHRLVFGNYPELLNINNLSTKADYLKEIVNSYLLKDILSFEGIKNSLKILNLLRLVAYQVGNQVSYHELGNQLNISKNTVERYLHLLSQSFILFKLEGFSKNLRKEITKSSKWYFYDNGVRNTLIANINAIELRQDTGQLWENYILSERIKYQYNTGMLVNNYFWRTYDKQEIDLIEEREGKLFAYEFKFRDKSINTPVQWKKNYPDAGYSVITPDNYKEFVGIESQNF